MTGADILYLSVLSYIFFGGFYFAKVHDDYVDKYEGNIYYPAFGVALIWPILFVFKVLKWAGILLLTLILESGTIAKFFGSLVTVKPYRVARDTAKFLVQKDHL